MKVATSQVLSKIAPRSMRWLQARWGDSGKRGRILSAMQSAGFDGRIMAGPFSGMVYSGISGHGSVLTPKLLGTYELELHNAIFEILATRPAQVIDIGAAEGYYAVGLACKLGCETNVIAFELEGAAREELARLAENNHVSSQVTCRGECTSSQLDNVLVQDCLVICDCEGGELELLDPNALPALRSAAVLVELHHRVAENIADVFLDRFAASHSIEHIRARLRSPSDCTALAGLRRRDAEVSLNEHRKYGIQWMWMKPFDSTLWSNSASAEATSLRC